MKVSLASRRRRSGLALAVLVTVARALATQAAGPAGGSASLPNEAALDFAVDTRGGPWCTAPLPAAPAARTLEGWFRLKAPEPGVLLDVGSEADARPALRLAVTAEPTLVVEGAGVSPPVEPLRLTRDAWTHFQLDTAAETWRVALFDTVVGHRVTEIPASAASAALSPGMRLCVGGTTAGDHALAAWVDELRVWSAELPAEAAAAWRDRRVSPAHPLFEALLADWPFRSGHGSVERGGGPLGALTTDQARWIELPRLAYGPVLGTVTTRSANVLFGARPVGEADARWTADVAVRPAAGGSWRTSPAGVEVGDATDFVAHVRLDGLEPQTRYAYLPMIDGRAAAGGPPEALPVFTTAPDLGGRNADFTAVFLADQHTAESPDAPSLAAYAAAAAARPWFWAQLGDIVPGSTDGTPEHKRDRRMLRALWLRNFGSWDSPQARLLRTVPLGFATISDHEITNNYDLNWHHHDYATAASPDTATLRDRIRQYDVSLARWWNHLGRGMERGDSLSRAAAEDFGRQAMGEAYATSGVYLARRPYPFVEFLVLDTTSYRGDSYQFRDRYGRTANRDTDHARYAWKAGIGSRYIFGDRAHGGNEITDRVRSWLGPSQKAAFLAALAGSSAQVVVVAAGYPLYSYKFEDDPRYWEGRESGFDFVTEVEEIVTALERLDRLVLWVHGDGHTPALVRLRKNLYQLQVGATILASGGTGHRSRTLGSGSRSSSDLLGGGLLMATHQPDLSPESPTNDVFREGLDTFEGFLRLYFHPGQEALRSSGRAGARRAAGGDAIELSVAQDPARNDAGRRAVGRVARLRFGPDTVHAVVRGYRFEPGRAVFRFDAGVVRADPDEFHILIDAVPWVEARWFDARGEEWRDLAGVLRREP